MNQTKKKEPVITQAKGRKEIFSCIFHFYFIGFIYIHMYIHRIFAFPSVPLPRNTFVISWRSPFVPLSFFFHSISDFGLIWKIQNWYVRRETGWAMPMKMGKEAAVAGMFESLEIETVSNGAMNGGNGKCAPAYA